MTVPTGGIRRNPKEFVRSGLKRTAIGCAFLYDLIMVMHVVPSGISLASSQLASARFGRMCLMSDLMDISREES